MRHPATALTPENREVYLSEAWRAYGGSEALHAPRFAGSRTAGQVWAFLNIFHPDLSLNARLAVASDAARNDPGRSR